jgi:hypothetical protein
MMRRDCCISGLLLSGCLGAIDGVDQTRINDLGDLRDFWLDWFLRWNFEITALCEQSSHVHLIDNIDIKVLVCLSDPLRSGGTEKLSSTFSARSWVLDEGNRVGFFEWCLPIIDRLIWVE